MSDDTLHDDLRAAGVTDPADYDEDVLAQVLRRHADEETVDDALATLAAVIHSFA